MIHMQPVDAQRTGLVEEPAFLPRAALHDSHRNLALMPPQAHALVGARCLCLQSAFHVVVKVPLLPLAACNPLTPMVVVVADAATIRMHHGQDLSARVPGQFPVIPLQGTAGGIVIHACQAVASLLVRGPNAADVCRNIVLTAGVGVGVGVGVDVDVDIDRIMPPAEKPVAVGIIGIPPGTFIRLSGSSHVHGR